MEGELLKVYTLSFSHSIYIGEQSINVYKFVPVGITQLEENDFRVNVPSDLLFKKVTEAFISGLGNRLLIYNAPNLVRELTEEEKKEYYDKQNNRGGG